MTIKDLVHTIKNIALKHNFIKNFNEGDVYEFMNNGEKQYGVINLTIDTINRVSANIMQLNATIIYIDRLTEDNDNKLDIWTTGTNTILQILNSLKQKGIMVNDAYDFTAFTEDEFQDLCAGVYATIEIQMVNNINECESITRRDIEITKNGTYDISEYDIANVNVPKPSGKIDITSNGLHNVTDYSVALVDVPQAKIQPLQRTVKLENGTETILPSDGYDAMAAVEITVDVPDTAITKVEWLTQEEYDAISAPSRKTLYNIVDSNENLIKQYQGDVLVWEKEEPITYDGLTFTAEQAGSTVKYTASTVSAAEYSFDTKTWNNANNVTVTLDNVGDKVYYRGTTGDQTGINGARFSMTGLIAASGNINSMNGGSDELTYNYCYSSLFSYCASLTKAPELPATTLTSYCYYGMFNKCTSLVETPELPATTLASYCYYYMFSSCTSLTKAPELPATTLATSCYRYMLAYCKSLTKAPELPATTLVSNCYSYMFCWSSRLTEAPELPATTLANYCYYAMFQGTDLTETPELPATTLANQCYTLMFEENNKLSKVITHITEWNTSYAGSWLSGVAKYGDFYNLGGADIPVGDSGIPSGWTEHKTLD